MKFDFKPAAVKFVIAHACASQVPVEVVIEAMAAGAAMVVRVEADRAHKLRAGVDLGGEGSGELQEK
jgi:uncharacterized membrane protein